MRIHFFSKVVHPRLFLALQSTVQPLLQPNVQPRQLLRNFLSINLIFIYMKRTLLLGGTQVAQQVSVLPGRTTLEVENHPEPGSSPGKDNKLAKTSQLEKEFCIYSFLFETVKLKSPSLGFEPRTSWSRVQSPNQQST